MSNNVVLVYFLLAGKREFLSMKTFEDVMK